MTVTPSSQSVEVTHTATFTTTVRGVGSSSFTYRWSRGRHHKIIKGETGSVLKVEKVSEKDHGRYSCYVENIYGDSAVSATVHLIITRMNYS